MRKPSTLFFLFLALAIACGASRAQETVRIQDFPGLGNLLGRVAVAQGFCEKHRIRCEMKSTQSSPIGVQMLLAGDLEVAASAQEVLVNALRRGSRLKAIGTVHASPMIFLSAGNHLELPNHAKGYPAVMHDLRGKRVGVPARGSQAEFQLASLLAGAGMSVADVTILAVGAPDTALPALRTKQVDAVMMFEPMGGFCKTLKACRIIVDLRKGQGTPDVLVKGANTALTVTAEFAQRKPQTVAAIQAAFRDAEGFAQNPANKAAVLQILSDTFKINVPDSQEVLKVVLDDSLSAFKATLDPQALQAVADMMFRSGQVDQRVDTSVLLLSKGQ